MAFLDNSGDIILDTTLTDEGRKRLARGNFRVTQFALGDDEINYALYDITDPNNEDTQILQTPILEAFTNNMSSLNSKLVTYSSADKLYLTVLKLSEIDSNSTTNTQLSNFVIAVDSNTEDNNESNSPTTALGINTSGQVQGVLFGRSVSKGLNYIRVDSGLDSNELSPGDTYPGTDKETAFKIEIDNRLGIISDKEGNDSSPVTIDNDGVATYVLSRTGNSNFVKDNTSVEAGSGSQAIAGPRGPYIEFKIRAQLSMQQSNYLFDTLGGTDNTLTAHNASTPTAKIVDSIIRVTGMTTGYTIHIPIRFVKL
tara:strand:+ start:827 stop:1762 length:936 start_codon:yes stop_codon:yes gene_type:complete